LTTAAPSAAGADAEGDAEEAVRAEPLRSSTGARLLEAQPEIKMAIAMAAPPKRDTESPVPLICFCRVIFNEPFQI
jgi:hypothetical protein